MARVLQLAFLAICVLVPCASTFAGEGDIFADGFERSANALVFTMPFQGTPQPASGDVDFTARIDRIDMYVILDRSGSMAAEITNIKNNLATVVDQLQCPPFGTGTPGTCIPDLWAGGGTVGYADSGLEAYRNYIDVQANPSFATLPNSITPILSTQEPLSFAVYAAITGNGGTAFGFPGVPARASCATSPAAAAGFATFGYACFRLGALPLVFLATDEQPLSPGDTNKTPAWSTIVLPEMLSRGARFIGILGGSFAVNTDVDLRTMATNTGAVDTGNANAPLVFNGADATAATAIRDGVSAAASRLPLQMRAVVEDDPGDAVDTLAAFVTRIEVLQPGTPLCPNVFAIDDSDGDAFPDRYSGVPVGTSVCWRLVIKANNSVPGGSTTKSFRATIRGIGDAALPQGAREVYFDVPPL